MHAIPLLRLFTLQICGDESITASPNEPFPKLQSRSLPTARSTNPHYEETHRSPVLPTQPMRSIKTWAPLFNTCKRFYKDDQNTLGKTNQSHVPAVWVYQTHGSAQLRYAHRRTEKNNIPTHVPHWILQFGFILNSHIFLLPYSPTGTRFFERTGGYDPVVGSAERAGRLVKADRCCSRKKQEDLCWSADLLLCQGLTRFSSVCSECSEPPGDRLWNDTFKCVSKSKA